MNVPTVPKFRYVRSMLAVMLFAVVVMGGAMGANVGYDASSVEETQFEYNDGKVYIGGELEEEIDTEVNGETDYQPWYSEMLDDRVPMLSGGTPIDPYVEAWSHAFTEKMLAVAFTLAYGSADIVATFVYHNRWWLPQIVVNGVFSLASFLPAAYVSYLAYSATQRGLGESMEGTH